MEENPVHDLETLFAQVEDPRVERTKRHCLRDIIILAICGADGWVEIEEFGKTKEAFFPEWLDVPNGIPSHDTFGRVLGLLDPKQCEASFFQWVQGIASCIKGVIAVDGKTLRRSHDEANSKKALHLVSAWATENRLVLAQLATEETSNEITAIPLLLQQLALSGCMVTIDAMGTQTKAVRSHWGIENSLHWVLDMAFRGGETGGRNDTPSDHGMGSSAWSLVATGFT